MAAALESPMSLTYFEFETKETSLELAFFKVFIPIISKSEESNSVFKIDAISLRSTTLSLEGYRAASYDFFWIVAFYRL